MEADEDTDAPPKSRPPSSLLIPPYRIGLASAGGTLGLGLGPGTPAGFASRPATVSVKEKEGVVSDSGSSGTTSRPVTAIEDDDAIVQTRPKSKPSPHVKP